MSAHNLSIAKASFLASCLRPDVTKLTRDELNKFHTVLETATEKCTPSNVEKTKEWLLEHVLPSSARTAALGKYLSSYSKNMISGSQVENKSEAKTIRVQLHILYVLNDLLHHTKYHTSNQSFRAHLNTCIQPYLLELFQYARLDGKSKILKRLENLLDIWEHEQYYSPSHLAKVREGLSADKPETQSVTNAATSSSTSQERPWIMPATHGDSSSAFFDLPAGNLMPHMVPNSSEPMRPEQIRALQLPSGPADESLVNAVKDFLKDVDALDNPYSSLETQGVVAIMDELGQLSYRNEGDEVVGDTYYGWSRAFCEKMRKRRTGDEPPSRRARSRNSSSSRSSRTRSRSPHKRRKFSNSSMSRSPSGSRSRSTSKSRFRRQSSDMQRNKSQSYSPGPVVPAFHQYQQPVSHAPKSLPLPSGGSYPPVQQQFQGPAFPSQAMSIPMPMPISVPPFQFPFGLNGLPIPPPRPAGWSGPWPPPLPPPTGFSNIGFPPPPPPGPHYHNHSSPGPDGYNNHQRYDNR